MTREETIKHVTKMMEQGWCQSCSAKPDNCIRTTKPLCLQASEDFEEVKNGEKSV